MDASRSQHWLLLWRRWKARTAFKTRLRLQIKITISRVNNFCNNIRSSSYYSERGHLPLSTTRPALKLPFPLLSAWPGFVGKNRTWWRLPTTIWTILGRLPSGYVWSKTPRWCSKRGSQMVIQLTFHSFFFVPRDVIKFPFRNTIAEDNDNLRYSTTISSPETIQYILS